MQSSIRDIPSYRLLVALSRYPSGLFTPTYLRVFVAAITS